MEKGPVTKVTSRKSQVASRGGSPGSPGWGVLAVSLGLLALLPIALGVTFSQGLGLWGIGVPVYWGISIVNFVWWIGIAHAGTFISAILLLARQSWRSSLSRFSETLTLFAIGAAAIFPIAHLGRPGLFAWVLPYPATTWLWPQFKSPLVWDAFAISTYGVVSAMFFYLSFLPDAARLRDEAPAGRLKYVYGVLALGWQGEGRQWLLLGKAQKLLAGLAAPLVISVHTVVSLNFAVTLVPGWHQTHFPPYFVAGAVYSGFAMVIFLLLPLGRILGAGEVLGEKILDRLGKVTLATGWMVLYGYGVEILGVLRGCGAPETALWRDRFWGASAWLFWTMIVLNGLLPQVLWFGRARKNPVILWRVAVGILAGMWIERFLIVVGSVEHGYLPSVAGTYRPSLNEILIFAGTWGLVLFGLWALVKWAGPFSRHELGEDGHAGRE